MMTTNLSLENSLVEFCKNNNDYLCCAEYFIEHPFSSIDLFLDNAQTECYNFSVKYPKISFGQFMEDLSHFQQSQLDKSATLSEEELPLPLCDHPCCVPFQEKVTALTDELKSMKEELSWLKNELKKFDHPEVIAKSCREGDFLLEDKWLLRGAMLQSAANDCSTKDISNLVDTVFGKSYLKSFKSPKYFPANLTRAYNNLIHYFTNAKLLVKGGEYQKIIDDSKKKLNKRFDNWSRYEAKASKKRKSSAIEEEEDDN